MTPTYLYFLLVILPNLHECNGIMFLSGLALVASITIHIICFITKADRYEREETKEIATIVQSKTRATTIVSLTLFLFFYLLADLTPTQEQIYTIAGGYAVTNDVELKKLPDNVLKAANTYLEKINKDLAAKPDAKRKD